MKFPATIASRHALITRAKYILLTPALAGLLLLPILLIGQAHAVAKTWDGGCGVDTTWSCANNWSDNIVPASGDTLTFNGTSTNNSVVDSSFAGTVTSITISSGYTGTLSLGRSLTVSGTFSQAAGTFTAGSQTLIMAAFTLSGGSFTASSATTSISGTVTISGSPTFSANGGTVNFNGTTAASVSCNSVTFNQVTFTKTAGSMTVNTGCNLPFGNNPTAGTGGSIGLSGGTISGTGTFSMAGSAGTLNMNSGGSFSGFTGLIAPNTTLSGTYDFSSYTTFTVGGSFALNVGGNFTAPSGTANFMSVFTLNSGATFNANGGTVNFNGTASVALSCGNKTFNLVTFTHTSGTKTVGSDCSLPLGANPNIIGLNGSVTLNGTLSGTGTLNMVGGGGTLTLNSGSSLSGFTGLTAATLQISGTYNFGSYTTFSTTSGFTVNSGASVTMPSGTATFPSTFTINSGATFNANGGTISFSSGTATLSCGNKTLNLVTFVHTTGTKTVSSDCSLPLGNDPTVGTGGAVTLNGTLTGSGTINKPGTNGFTLGTTGSLSGFTGLSTTGSLTVNGTYNFGSYSPFSVADNFVLNSGAVFTAPSGTANFSRNFTINSGSTFNANGGTVNFNGTLPIGITCNNATFNLVTFTHTAGTKTANAGCNIPVGNNPVIGLGGSIGVTGTLTGTGLFTATGTTLNAGGVLSGFSGMSVGFLIVNGTADFSNYSPFSAAGNFLLNSSGVFTAPSGTASFGGNVTLTTGSTFNANGGTVVLTGTNQAIAGNNPTFYNLTKTVSSAATLTFSASNAITVAGTLTLKGVNGGLLSLVSTIPSTSWFINAQGATDVSYVNVADSHVLGATVTACNSTDSGGNTGWSFNPSACNPTHGSDGATAVNNYEALQAALVSQSDQDQSQPPTAAASSSGLASKLNQFVKQFPGGKALAKAAMQFLRVMLGLVIFGLLFVGFLFLLGWRRRKEEEEAADAIPAVITPTVIKPPSIPGSTVHPAPLVPKDTIPFKLPNTSHGEHHNTGTGGRAW